MSVSEFTYLLTVLLVLALAYGLVFLLPEKIRFRATLLFSLTFAIAFYLWGRMDIMVTFVYYLRSLVGF